MGEFLLNFPIFSKKNKVNLKKENAGEKINLRFKGALFYA